MLHMPTPMLISVSGRTYEQWLAHILTRASSLVTNTRSNVEGYGGLVRVQLASSAISLSGLTGAGFATSPGEGGVFNGPFEPAIQQGLPSAAVMGEQKAAAQILLVDQGGYVAGSDLEIAGATRNSVTSNSLYLSAGEPACNFGTSPSTGENVGISYWDVGLNKPVSVFPRSGFAYGPFDYTAAGWSL